MWDQPHGANITRFYKEDVQVCCVLVWYFGQFLSAGQNSGYVIEIYKYQI